MLKIFQSSRSSKKLIYLVYFLIAYVLLGRLGLHLATINKVSSPVWPATGLAISFLLISGRSYLNILLVFAGAFLVNFFFTDSTFTTNLLIAFGNATEAFAGYFIYVFTLKKTRHWGLFAKFLGIIFASIFAPIFSATIGTLSLYLHKIILEENFFKVWATWLIGDSIGAVLVIPALLLFSKNHKTIKFHIGVKEAFYLVLSIVPIFFVFCTEKGAPFLFLILLSLLIISIKTSIKWSYIFLFIISAFGIWSAFKNIGPFGGSNVNENIIRLQIFMFGLSMTAMLLEYLIATGNFKMPAVAIFVGWLISGTAFFMLYKFAEQSDKARFNSLCDKIEEHSIRTLDLYFRALESGAALFSSSTEVSAEEWKIFINKMKLNERYPGMNGIGLIREVEQKNLNLFLKKHNLTLKTVPHGDEISLDRKKINHLIITYIEPLESNTMARGLDISTEWHRREAAIFSKMTGQGAITKKIILIQDQKKGPGFLIYYPFYKEQDLVKNEENRKNNFLGLIYAPVTFEKYMTAASKEFSNEVHIGVYSSDQFTSENVLYSNFPDSNNNFDMDLIRKKIFGGTPIFFVFKKSEKFKNSLGILSSFFGLLGCLFSLFIAIIISNLELVNRKAKRLVRIRESQLVEAQAAAVQTARLSSLGQMAGSIAHEINNPLAIIGGKASQIARTVNAEHIENTKLLELSKSIVSTVERITKIVKNLKIVARDGQKDPLLPVPLPTIIDTVVSLCSQKYANHSVDLVLPKIPEYNIVCREVQISQVLTNLFNNSFDAVSHLDEKWIKLEISDLPASASSKVANGIRIRVSDSGKGIPKEIVSKLMTPFFTTKDPGKGTGLGLSLSRSIIHDHSGKFYYELHEDHTSFVIELPLDTAVNSAAR